MSDLENDSSNPPMSTLPSVVVATVAFIFLWYLFSSYISSTSSIPWAHPVTRLNSSIYALFSLFLSISLANSYLDCYIPPTISLLGIETQLGVRELGYIYHVSKYYEYIDVFNLVAQGVPIGKHMAFHHLTTPFLSYFRVLNTVEGVVGTRGNDWRVFALLNCIHHTLMYAYFGGMQGSWARGRLGKVLPVTGYGQLVGGVAVDGLWLARNVIDEGEKGSEMTGRVVSALLLARYFVLYHEERSRSGRGY